MRSSHVILPFERINLLDQRNGVPLSLPMRKTSVFDRLIVTHQSDLSLQPRARYFHSETVPSNI